MRSIKIIRLKTRNKKFVELEYLLIIFIAINASFSLNKGSKFIFGAPIRFIYPYEDLKNLNSMYVNIKNLDKAHFYIVLNLLLILVDYSI